MLVFTNPGTEFANGVELHDFMDIVGISKQEALDYIQRNPDTIRMVDEDAEYFAALEKQLEQEWLEECEQYDADFNSYYGIEDSEEHFFMDMPGEQFELFPCDDLPF
jgi:hypothetical protein